MIRGSRTSLAIQYGADADDDEEDDVEQDGDGSDDDAVADDCEDLSDATLERLIDMCGGRRELELSGRIDGTRAYLRATDAIFGAVLLNKHVTVWRDSWELYASTVASGMSFFYDWRSWFDKQCQAGGLYADERKADQGLHFLHRDTWTLLRLCVNSVLGYICMLIHLIHVESIA